MGLGRSKSQILIVESSFPVRNFLFSLMCTVETLLLMLKVCVLVVLCIFENCMNYNTNTKLNMRLCATTHTGLCTIYQLRAFSKSFLRASTFYLPFHALPALLRIRKSKSTRELRIFIINMLRSCMMVG